MFLRPSDPVVVECLSVAKVFHLGKDGPLVGSLPDGHWNRTPNLLLRLHVCLSRLQVLHTGQVAVILSLARTSSCMTFNFQVILPNTCPINRQAKWSLLSCLDGKRFVQQESIANQVKPPQELF